MNGVALITSLGTKVPTQRPTIIRLQTSHSITYLFDEESTLYKVSFSSVSSSLVSTLLSLVLTTALVGWSILANWLILPTKGFWLLEEEASEPIG